MAHKHDEDDDDQDLLENMDDERERDQDLLENMDDERDFGSAGQGGTSTLTRVLAFIGVLAIAAIVVPAVLALWSEGPNMRRYLRIMRM